MYDSAAYYYVSLNLHPFLIFWFCTYLKGYFHKKCIQNSADMRYYQNLILIHCCLHKQSHIIWHITQNPHLIISIFSQSLHVIGIPASSSFWRKYPYICSPFWWHSNTKYLSSVSFQTSLFGIRTIPIRAAPANSPKSVRFSNFEQL